MSTRSHPVRIPNLSLNYISISIRTTRTSRKQCLIATNIIRQQARRVTTSIQDCPLAYPTIVCQIHSIGIAAVVAIITSCATFVVIEAAFGESSNWVTTSWNWTRTGGYIGVVGEDFNWAVDESKVVFGSAGYNMLINTSNSINSVEIFLPSRVNVAIEVTVVVGMVFVNFVVKIVVTWNL